VVFSELCLKGSSAAGREADGVKVDGRPFSARDARSGSSTVRQESLAVLRVPGAAARSRFGVTEECHGAGRLADPNSADGRGAGL